MTTDEIRAVADAAIRIRGSTPETLKAESPGTYDDFFDRAEIWLGAIDAAGFAIVAKS